MEDWSWLDGPLEVDLDKLADLPEAEQKEIAGLLAAWRAAVKANPLLNYMPHAKQKLFHAATQKVRGFVGGNQSGKTTAGVVDSLIETIQPDLIPPWLAPFRKNEGNDFFVRVEVVDLIQALEGVMLPKIRAMVPKAALYKSDWDKAWNARRRRLTFATGNWWEFLTHDMEVDQHAGGTLHRVWYDEEPPGNKGGRIKEENDVRLLHYDGDSIWTMTPLLGFSTVAFTELMDRHGEPRADEETFVVTVDMDENPHLSDRAKKRTLKGMSAESRKARKEGKFVHFAGRIYPQFNRDVHVVPAVELARDHRGTALANVYVGIDPGIDHPTALVWVTHSSDDVFEVVRSMKFSDITTPQVCSLIMATNQELGVNPRWYVIDPSARNRNPQTGKSLQMNYQEHGIVAMPGNNDRRSGFDRIRELLAPVDLATGKPMNPRLFVHGGNDLLVEEFEKYRWKPAPGSEALAKEEPIKVNDDILDALRYVIMSRTHKGDELEEEEKREPEPIRAFRQHLARIGRRNHMHPLGPGVFK